MCDLFVGSGSSLGGLAILQTDSRRTTNAGPFVLGTPALHTPWVRLTVHAHDICIQWHPYIGNQLGHGTNESPKWHERVSAFGPFLIPRSTQKPFQKTNINFIEFSIRFQKPGRSQNAAKINPKTTKKKMVFRCVFALCKIYWIFASTLGCFSMKLQQKCKPRRSFFSDLDTLPH